jgi:hypothetical protein
MREKNGNTSLSWHFIAPAFPSVLSDALADRHCVLACGADSSRGSRWLAYLELLPTKGELPLKILKFPKTGDPLKRMASPAGPKAEVLAALHRSWSYADQFERQAVSR